MERNPENSIIPDTLSDFLTAKGELEKGIFKLVDKFNIEQALRAYKKRAKALQRRISAEQGVNKRLKLLLAQCEQQIPNGLLKDLVKHELDMLKYKYY